MNYVRNLLFVFRLSARLCGAGRFAITCFWGCLAKVALLAAFILVVRVAVTLLSANPESLVGIDQWEFTVATLTWTTLGAIPVLFFVAGFLVYLGRKHNRDFARNFAEQVRILGIEAYFAKFEFDAPKARHDYVRDYINKIDPDLRRGSTNILTGCIELLQAAIVSAVVLTALATQNFWISLVTVSILMIAVPLYVRGHARRAVSEKEERVRVKEAHQALKTETINSNAVTQGDIAAVKQGIYETTLGKIGKTQLQFDYDRSIAAHRAIGPVYGLMGVVLAYLLFDIFVLTGAPDAEQITRFAVIALILRFLAGEVQSVLSAGRLINSDYHLIDERLKPIAAANTKLDLEYKRDVQT